MAQDGPLDVARDLYASARYDEALAMLNDVRQQESGNPINLRSIEQYRSLCLLALGRGAEAEAAIAVVVASDPLYQPTETEASPRVRTAFSEVRQRQLPDIARTRYASAKASFDRKDYPSAEQQFRDLLRLIDDPDMGGRLGDLRMLVTGFVDLSAAAAAPPPEPKPEPRREEVPPPAPSPALPDPQRVYTSDDEGVIAGSGRPAGRAARADAGRQPDARAGHPRRDHRRAGPRHLGAAIRVGLHPIYDSQILLAAKEWRYQPALLNGRPVKFRKIIQITVTKR